MKFQTSLVIALVGAAATMASAQKLAPAPVRAQIDHRITLGTGNDTRALNQVAVYDSWEAADAAGELYFFYGTGLNGNADDFNMDLPRVGQGIFGPISLTLTRYSGLFVSLGGADFNYVVIWFNKGRSWSSVGPTDPIGGIAFQFTGLPGAGGYSFDAPGLESLSTPIAFTHNDACLLQGNTTPDGSAYEPDTYTGFSGDGSPSGEDGGPAIGWSDDYFWPDLNGDGGVDGTESFYYFGGSPAVSNIAAAMDVLYCDTDFDGSGFQDFDDFNAYVGAFEAGC